jgi:hypothetical protein
VPFSTRQRQRARSETRAKLPSDALLKPAEPGQLCVTDCFFYFGAGDGEKK